MAGRVPYEELVALVQQLFQEGILEPVKSKGTNGRRPPLFNKYRINKPSQDYSVALEEIKLLHPKFNISKYANQPEMYVKYQREIQQLNHFLWKAHHLLDEPMSINERSFQIWGMEKLLKDKSVIQSIGQFNDWDLSFLNYYETPEPFFDYHFSSQQRMNILIIENKDTWFSLRKIMREDGLNHLFREYHVLLYGEGKKITSRNHRLEEYDQMLSGSVNTYYYFGDLDYEGIEIYQTLLENNNHLEIRLCTELYSWMLKEATNYELPPTKAGQRRMDIQDFTKLFTEEEAAEIQRILESGLYIPQEILNYPLMKIKMARRVENLND